jgi:hypothetical protein
MDLVNTILRINKNRAHYNLKAKLL